MAGNEGKRRKRSLSLEERTLWKRVTETLTPLPDKHPAPKKEKLSEDPAPALPAKPTKKTPAPVRMTKKPVKQAPPPPPPLAPFDRRTLQRLVRGSVSIDGKIDLHGMTQAQAHGRLHGYLAGAQARGHKTILVITGKGGDRYGGEERGILRRVVPMWLQLPEFRSLVAGFEEAHGTHGGSGALYVRIRRKKGDVTRE